MSKFTPPILLLCLLTCASATAYEPRPSLPPEELAVLRAAAEAALKPRRCEYVAVSRNVGVREDRISRLLEEGPGVVRELAASLLANNSRKARIRISSAQQKLLGQRDAELAHLASGRGGCRLRFSRVGWSGDRRQALVYIGFQEGSSPGAVLLELAQQEGKWQAVEERASVQTIVVE